MSVLEYGNEHEKALLFLPCTAEPEWAFTDSVKLLARDYHVMQMVYDGHGATGEDFVSVEATVDEITDWLQAHGVTRLDAAYGCSLGGACLTRFLALGKIPVNRAIIDAGITPYQMPFVLRRLACLRDFLGFRLVTKTAKFWKQPIRRIVGRCRGVIPRRSTMRCRKSRCRRAAASRTGTVKRRKRRGAAI